MRKIKCRGYNAKNKKWIYGYYLKTRGKHFICPDEFATGKSWDDYEVDPESVGQFTGLHDKNGKEIFDGDVLKIKEPNGYYSEVEVSFCDKGYWAINHGINERVIAGFVDAKKIEVIGNIYDNPELIKKR